MAQADQIIQNATFPAVRADINNNLAALFTNSSGGTAPTVTVAYQDWIDTSGTDPIWKKRNAANNAWITVATIKSNAVELAADNVLPSQSGNSGKYLSTDGTIASWEPIVSGINAAEVFVSSGNWTCPAGIQKVLVMVIGGGGGGEARINLGGFPPTFGNGSTGRAGGYGAGVLAVTAGTVYTVTIGAGGAGATGDSGQNGAGGGTSTFGTISATGGAGGGTGGSAGTCSSADATLRRSSVERATPFLVNGDEVRSGGLGTAAVAWSITNNFGPGAAGAGSASSTSSGAAGGVGGAVLLFY